jgi:hypothetical protein
MAPRPTHPARRAGASARADPRPRIVGDRAQGARVASRLRARPVALPRADRAVRQARGERRGPRVWADVDDRGVTAASHRPAPTARRSWPCGARPGQRDEADRLSGHGVRPAVSELLRPFGAVTGSAMQMETARRWRATWRVDELRTVRVASKTRRGFARIRASAQGRRRDRGDRSSSSPISTRSLCARPPGPTIAAGASAGGRR